MKLGRNWAAMAGAALALVLIGGLIGWMASRSGTPAPPVGAPPAAGAAAQLAPGDSVPSTLRAMQDLLGAAPGGGVQERPGTRTSLWAQFTFDSAAGPRHVAFFATQALDGQGLPEDCHACAPELGAVTYKFAAGAWHLEARDQAIARLGQWGKPPEPPAAQQLLQLSNYRILQTPQSSTGQGYTEAGIHLLAYAAGWRYFGTIWAGGDNEGTSDCADRNLCYRSTGTIRVASGTGGTLPHLIVDAQGTEMDADRGSIVPAKSVTYEFNGTTYILKGNAALPTATPAETVRAPQDALVLHGEFLKYPRAAQLSRVKTDFEYLKCFGPDPTGATLCAAAKSHPATPRFLEGLPGGCTADISLSFLNGKLKAVTCSDVTQAAIDSLDTALRQKFGAPKTDTVQIATIRGDHMEWSAGQDYILMMRFTGKDMHGRPVINYSVAIADRPALPLGR